MFESRNIVLILGNGFDLDLGLQTSYKDFWKSDFCPKDYPAPLINHLNQRWGEDLDAVKWYDLENELLNYYNYIQNKNQVLDVLTDEEKAFVKTVNMASFPYGVETKYSDAAKTLFKKKYLIPNPRMIPPYYMPYQDDMKESPTWRDQKALELIKERLCSYLKSLKQPLSESLSVASNVLLSLSKSVNAGNTINIYTFNYTRVQKRGRSLDNIPVHYMHGSCEDGKIIVGTRDSIHMVPEYDFLQKVMDDSFTPPDIVSALKKTDEVIIFGHSLGENDRQYFESFFTKQVSIDNNAKKDVFIFTRDTNSKADIKRALQNLTGSNLSTLYSVNQPVIIRTGELDKDQHAFFDFLINHHTDKNYAEEIIGKLLKS